MFLQKMKGTTRYLKSWFTPFMTKHIKFSTAKIVQYIYNQNAFFCIIRNINAGLSSFSNATQSARMCVTTLQFLSQFHVGDVCVTSQSEIFKQSVLAATDEFIQLVPRLLNQMSSFFKFPP